MGVGCRIQQRFLENVFVKNDEILLYGETEIRIKSGEIEKMTVFLISAPSVHSVLICLCPRKGWDMHYRWAFIQADSDAGTILSHWGDESPPRRLRLLANSIRGGETATGLKRKLPRPGGLLARSEPAICAFIHLHATPECNPHSPSQNMLLQDVRVMLLYKWYMWQNIVEKVPEV